MSCDQARERLEELLREGRSWEEIPELAEHLAQCHNCQVWHAQYRQVEEALDRLPTLPVPPDFSERVLNRLSELPPEAAPSREAARAGDGGAAPGVSRWRERWQAFWSGLASPRGRRQLVPVLVAATCVVLVVALVYALQASDAPPVPGAATGTASWAVIGGAGVLTLLLIVGLFLWGRKR